MFAKIKAFRILRKNKKISFLFFFAVAITILIAIAGYSIIKEFSHIEQNITSRSKSAVEFSAILIEENIQHMVDVAVSLATRPLVEKGAENGKWEEAETIIHDAPDVFPYIDSIAILDKEGTLRAIVPSAPGIIGKNFAYRDYYQEVSKNWQPYVTPVFKKAGGHQDNIVSVVIPIRSTDTSRVTGIMAVGVRLDAIEEWSNSLATGTGDMAYIVDQKENIITHNDGTFSHSDDSLHKILAHKAVGEKAGVEVVSLSSVHEEFLVAHSPVARYGWGVVLMRPTAVAFTERTNGFLRIAFPWFLTLVFIGTLLYFILKNRESLQRERDHEQLLLDSIGDGVIAIDRSWNITLWNRSAGIISGWSREEVIGKPLRSIVKFLKEPEREEHFSFIEDAIISGNVRSVERGLILVKKDGSEVSVSDSAASVVGARGESEGAIIVFRDVTKDRETEHMRSDFAYAAHQLRTPVTEALWNIETAKTERIAKKRNDSLEVAHEAMLSVKDLEEHLITVSDIERGIVVLRVAHASLHETFDELTKILLPKAKANDVSLVFDTSLMPEAVHSDKKLLKGALYELIENAILYNHKGEKTVVRTSIQDGNLIFEIEDHGVGIPLEEQAIVFTKFYRGSNRGARVSGSGLGLYVAREYVRILDGKIWFKTEEGVGSTFFISIPVR